MEYQAILKPATWGRPAALRHFYRFLIALQFAGAGAWQAMPAEAVLQPGEPAPAFSLPDAAGKNHGIDAATTGTTLLFFSKTEDKFSSESLHALERILARQPELGKDLRRWIILSRLPDARRPETPPELQRPHWPLLFDTTDAIYKAYRIIATPTVVIVKNGRVAAVHPGYDPSMEHDVWRKLAAAVGVALPPGATGDAPPPNMNLQLGRRLAARGLWENALQYYEKAATEITLPDEARFELGELYLQLKRPGDAIPILRELQAKPEWAAKVTPLLERALATGPDTIVSPPQPPKVNR